MRSRPCHRDPGHHPPSPPSPPISPPASFVSPMSTPPSARTCAMRAAPISSAVRPRAMKRRLHPDHAGGRSAVQGAEDPRRRKPDPRRLRLLPARPRGEGFCRLGPGIEIEGPALASECQAQRPDPPGLHRQPLRPFARLDRRPRHRAGDDAAAPLIPPAARRAQPRSTSAPASTAWTRKAARPLRRSRRRRSRAASGWSTP